MFACLTPWSFWTGTTNSAVAAMEGGQPTIVANNEGQRTTPSVFSLPVVWVKENEQLNTSSTLRVHQLLPAIYYTNCFILRQNCRVHIVFKGYFSQIRKKLWKKFAGSYQCLFKAHMQLVQFPSFYCWNRLLHTRRKVIALWDKLQSVRLSFWLSLSVWLSLFEMMHNVRKKGKETHNCLTRSDTGSLVLDYVTPCCHVSRQWWIPKTPSIQWNVS